MRGEIDYDKRYESTSRKCCYGSKLRYSEGMIFCLTDLMAIDSCKGESLILSLKLMVGNKLELEKIAVSAGHRNGEKLYRRVNFR